MTEPCPKCPFRTDVRPFLRKARAREIVTMLTRQQGTFQCHMTVDYEKAEDDDGEIDAIVAASSANAQHCAGALIMLEHMEQPNQMMRICERIGEYDRRKLNMAAPVFTSGAAFIKSQGR
jgi:hypothetical protein